MKIDSHQLKDIVSRFHNARILIVGDLILDKFIWGKVSRISPEAPVPVVEIKRESFMPGGAANVANNIAALGASPLISGTIGADASGDKLKRILNKDNINLDGIMVNAERPTAVKTRVIAHNQHVVRIDRENTDSLKPETLRALLDLISTAVENVDAVIIEDYGKGVITEETVTGIVKLCKKEKRILTVDPKEGYFLDYTGATAVTPNREEAYSAAGMRYAMNAPLEDVGKKLLELWKSKAILITLGDKGMCLFEQAQDAAYIPTVTKEVYDVSGAGDTVVAVFTLALACGATMQEAAALSNFAAGIVVGKLGTATLTREELLESITKNG